MNNMGSSICINSGHAYKARVTVIDPCVCVCVHARVCMLLVF